jgi:hypothetical protein
MVVNFQALDGQVILAKNNPEMASGIASVEVSRSRASTLHRVTP